MTRSTTQRTRSNRRLASNAGGRFKRHGPTTIKYNMRIKDVIEAQSTQKPLNPAQARIRSLKQQVDAAKLALQRERQRQVQQKLQKQAQLLAKPTKST